MEIGKRNKLGYFIEDLWTQGFKLTDENIRFIYLGKNSTNAEDWKVIKALKVTLQLKVEFDGSFYLSVLELLAHSTVRDAGEANHLLREKGLYIK